MKNVLFIARRVQQKYITGDNNNDFCTEKKIEMFACFVIVSIITIINIINIYIYYVKFSFPLPTSAMRLGVAMHSLNTSGPEYYNIKFL